MPDISFTQPPEPPLRSDSGDDFAAKADAFVSWQVVFAGELAANVSYFDDTLTTVAADRDAVAIDRGQVAADLQTVTTLTASAVTAAGEAEAARDQAQTYEGDARTLRDQTEQLAGDVASAIVYQDLAGIGQALGLANVKAIAWDDTVLPMWAQVGKSWYDEPLGTSRRGVRRDMPQLKLIVATSDRVSIYDADDPSLPMWKTFSTDQLPNTGHFVPTSVQMRNGRLVLGSAASLQTFISLWTWDFARDLLVGNRRADLECLVSDGTAQAFTWRPDYGQLLIPATHSVELVEAPGAALDSQSGLPKTTILAGTGDGIFVIGPEGNGHTVTAASYTLNVRNAQVTPDNKIAFTYDSGSLSGQRALGIIDWPSANVSLSSVDYLKSAEVSERYIYKIGGAWVGDVVFPIAANSMQKLAVGDSVIAMTGNDSLLWIDRSPSTPANTLYAMTFDDYATGWMHNETVRCWLTEIDTAPLAGQEFVENGSFETVAAGQHGYDNGDGTVVGWTAVNGGTASVVGNQLVVDMPESGNFGVGYDLSGIAVGTWVVVRFTLAASSGVGLAYVNMHTSFGAGGQSLAPVAAYSLGTYEFQFQINSTAQKLNFYGFTGAGTFTLDDVSVQVGLPDRSKSAKPLVASGSVVRTPVADGADLASYRLYGNAGSLRADDASVFGTGTGDFTFSTWFKADATAYVFDVFDNSNGSRIYLYLSSVTGFNGSFLGGGTAVGQQFLDGAWHHIVATREGTTVLLAVDGKIVFTREDASDYTISADSYIQIGSRYSVAQGANGIALFRFATASLSRSQIARMYAQERDLFRPGGRAVLGGAGSIKGISCDPASGLMHVLQDDGLNTFKGLRRIGFEAGGGNAVAALNSMIAKG